MPGRPVDEGGGGESHVAHQMASNFTQLSVELHDAAGRDKTIASLAPANILFLFSLFSFPQRLSNILRSRLRTRATTGRGGGSTGDIVWLEQRYERSTLVFSTSLSLSPSPPLFFFFPHNLLSATLPATALPATVPFHGPFSV